MLGRISNNRFSGVGIGAGITASSAATEMVIGLVNAGYSIVNPIGSQKEN